MDEYLTRLDEIDIWAIVDKVLAASGGPTREHHRHHPDLPALRLHLAATQGRTCVSARAASLRGGIHRRGEEMKNFTDSASLHTPILSGLIFDNKRDANRRAKDESLWRVSRSRRACLSVQWGRPDPSRSSAQKCRVGSCRGSEGLGTIGAASFTLREHTHRAR